MARILIVGKGGYGDMFPLFALAQALKASGHMVRIAAETHHGPATSSIGVGLIPLDPAPALGPAHGKNSGLTLGAKFDELLRTLAPVGMEEEYELLSEEVRSSDLIIGNQLAYTGAIAAKKWRKPWVFCAPSPLAIPSFLDPPLFPYLHRLQQLAARQGVSQDHFIRLARYASKRLMRANLGLQKRLGVYDGTHPRFEGMYSGLLNIMPVSPSILSHQADWPSHTVLTGFSWFEPAFMRDASELRAISAFVERGDRPVIIAPGGIKRTQPGHFFVESLAACKQLGLRAIVIAAGRFRGQFQASEDVFVSGYVPYSAVLGAASAIIHSAGIGTIGWSLKYALPSLLVPSDWDQFDNARRISRRGLASCIAFRELRAPRIATALEALLRDSALKSALAEVSKVVEREDGTQVALAEIERLLERLG